MIPDRAKRVGEGSIPGGGTFGRGGFSSYTNHKVLDWTSVGRGLEGNRSVMSNCSRDSRPTRGTEELFFTKS